MQTDRTSRRTLTDTFIRGLKSAPLGKRDEYWDMKVPGFGVRVTDRGAKTFVLYARFPPAGTPARRAIGDAGRMGLAAAREKARDWLDLIEQGRDPKEVDRKNRLAEQLSRRTTFEVVAEDWLREAVLARQRKGHEVARDVRREFVARWANRPVTEISPLDARDVVRDVKNRGAEAQARNLLGYVRRLFDWAVAQHAYGLDQSPIERLRPKDIVGKKVLRQRVLTDTELRVLWQAAEELEYPYGPLFRMLALTGQRKSEVAEARWREFDLAKRLWTIPPERMKGDATHAVPLANDLLNILEMLPRFKKGDYLFSTTFGVKPVNGFSKAKARLDAAMADKLGGSIDPFAIHDIRRTMRTGMSALPIPDLVRELVIAHARPGLHKVYDQFAYLEEKRHALELWTAKLRDIVSPPPSADVILLHR